MPWLDAPALTLGSLALWAGSGLAAASLARRRGYPVIWLAVLLGPVGLAAIVRLACAPRPPFAARQELMQRALAGTAGVPAAGDPDWMQRHVPALAPIFRAARERGRESAFWEAAADYVRYERLWDRALPWLVLALGGGALAGGAVAAMPASFGGGALWRLAAIPGAVVGFVLAAPRVGALADALAAGQQEALSRCAAAAGDPVPDVPARAAQEAAEAVRHLQALARIAGFAAAGGALSLVLARWLVGR